MRCVSDDSPWHPGGLLTDGGVTSSTPSWCCGAVPYLSLRQYLGTLPRSQRQRISRRLRHLSNASALDSSAVRNIYSDHRVHDRVWDTFSALLFATPQRAAALRVAITGCFKHHLLRGPTVRRVPTRTGRAVTLDNFTDMLKTEKVFASSRAAQRAILAVHGKPINSVRRRLHYVPLGRHVMWSTFCPQDPIANAPFDGIDSCADNVRGLLGLSRADRGLLLLLEYEVDASVPARYPTVVEGYAGMPWNYFFSPAPPGAPHGETMPWPEYEDEQARPEVVHKVLHGGTLMSAPRTIP